MNLLVSFPLVQPEPKFSKSKSNSLWDVKDLASHTLTSKHVYTVASPPDSNQQDTSLKNPSSSKCDGFSTHIKPNMPNTNDQINGTDQSTKNSTVKTKQENCGGQPFVAPSDCQLSEVELRLIPRFTEDEIRQIPRFQNWSPGEPSKVCIYPAYLENKLLIK